MWKPLILIVCTCLCLPLLAQNTEAANDLIREGIVLHDQGQYGEALAKYDEALELDPANFYALAEKTVTLFHMGRTDECVQLSEQILATQGAHDEIGMVYIAYGNSLDHAKRPEEALKVYARGQEVDPSNYQLWYNEAITLIGLGRYQEAIDRLQRSLRTNPQHGSSHNAMGRLLAQDRKRIPAIMALSRFLIVEPQSSRSEQNLQLLKDLMKGSVETNKKGGITIHVDAGDIPEGDSTSAVSDLSSVALLMDLLAVSDIDKKKKASELDRFTTKFDIMCAMVDGTKQGFIGEYYIPYFKALKESGHLNTAVMVMHATAGDPVVDKWLKKNSTEIERFYEWSSDHEWE